MVRLPEQRIFESNQLLATATSESQLHCYQLMVFACREAQVVTWVAESTVIVAPVSLTDHHYHPNLLVTIPRIDDLLNSNQRWNQ